MPKKTLRILGVMTGTSCDGLDASCIQVSHHGWETLWTSSVDYPILLKKKVLHLQQPDTRKPIQDWLQLHRDLGIWYGETLKKIIGKHTHTPDLIANHGQTVAHIPQSPPFGMTLQLGDPCRIAQITRKSVISNFRDGDLAAGGQGAPLVPLFHQILVGSLSDVQQGVSIHNLGGISNFTYLGPSDNLISFDTGPGNIWIDAAVSKVSKGRFPYDPEGTMASQGKADWSAVKKALKHRFFLKPPPKSTGRDDFPVDAFFSLTSVKKFSLVATATEITAQSVAQAYRQWILNPGLPLSSVYFCGGGAKNLYLLDRIQTLLPEVRIRSISDLHLDSQYIEATAFALMGFFSVLGYPLGGSWTGVRSFGPPGHLIPGENWSNLIPTIQSLAKTFIPISRNQTKSQKKRPNVR